MSGPLREPRHIGQAQLTVAPGGSYEKSCGGFTKTPTSAPLDDFARTGDVLAINGQSDNVGYWFADGSVGVSIVPNIFEAIKDGELAINVAGTKMAEYAVVDMTINQNGMPACAVDASGFEGLRLRAKALYSKSNQLSVHLVMPDVIPPVVGPARPLAGTATTAESNFRQTGRPSTSPSRNSPSMGLATRSLMPVASFASSSIRTRFNLKASRSSSTACRSIDTRPTWPPRPGRAHGRAEGCSAQHTPKTREAGRVMGTSRGVAGACGGVGPASIEKTYATSDRPHHCREQAA